MPRCTVPQTLIILNPQRGGGKKTFLILLMLVECLKANYTIKRLGSGYAERVSGYTTNLSLIQAVNTSIMHWPIFI